MKKIWLIIAAVLILPGVLVTIPVGLWPGVPTVAILPWACSRLIERRKWKRWEKEIQEELA